MITLILLDPFAVKPQHRVSETTSQRTQVTGTWTVLLTQYTDTKIDNGRASDSARPNSCVEP